MTAQQNTETTISLHTVRDVRRALKTPGLKCFVPVNYDGDVTYLQTTKQEILFLLRNQAVDENLQTYGGTATHYVSSNTLYL